MTELKQDYLTGKWVCFSHNRSKRPQQFTDKEIVTNLLVEKECPFCPENVHLLPSIIYEDKDKRIKIVENKYPALTPLSINGFGFHDVLIDTESHTEKLKDFSTEDVNLIFSAFRQRLDQLNTFKQIKYVQIFKNDGPKAGASIFHSHWQIIALPIIPSKQTTIINNLKKYNFGTGSCFICDEIKNVKQNTFAETKNLIAYMPETVLYAYSICITTKKHKSDIRDLTENELIELSKLLKLVLKAYNKKFKNLSYNIFLQNASFDEDKDKNHFYLQIVPRIHNFAGFELATDCYINSTFSVDGIKELRGLI